MSEPLIFDQSELEQLLEWVDPNLEVVRGEATTVQQLLQSHIALLEKHDRAISAETNVKPAVTNCKCKGFYQPVDCPQHGNQR